MGSYDRYLKDAVNKYGNVLEFKKGDISLLVKFSSIANICSIKFENEKELTSLICNALHGNVFMRDDIVDTLMNAKFELTNIFQTSDTSIANMEITKIKECIDTINRLFKNDAESEFAVYEKVIKKYFPKWLCMHIGILLITKDNDKLGYVAVRYNNGKYGLSLKYDMLNTSSGIFEFNPNELEEDSEGYRSYIISEDKLIKCMNSNNVLWTPAFNIDKELPIFINYSSFINSTFDEGYDVSISSKVGSINASSYNCDYVCINIESIDMSNILTDTLLCNGMNCNHIMDKDNFINMIIKNGYIIS